MVVFSIVLSGLELADGVNYWFHFSGTWDFEKDIQTNDIFSDGQEFGRSKTGPKTLTLVGYVIGDSESLQSSLNAVLAPNGLKTLIINNTYQANAEVTSRGSTADNSRAITIALTMPDPRWYALQPDTLALEPHIDNGVIFGDVTRIPLDAGASDAAVRTLLDASGSDDSTRTTLDAGGSN
ncbi:MAG: phage tail protein [Ethanoligenens sp.]